MVMVVSETMVVMVVAEAVVVKAAMVVMMVMRHGWLARHTHRYRVKGQS